MKRKISLALCAVLTIISLSSISPKKIQAAYGQVGHVVTPVNMRGKWYYKGSTLLGQNPKMTYKVKISKHHIGNLKLYQANSNITNKYAQNYKKYRFVIDQTMNWGNATIFNQNGVQWLNVNGWTAGAGNGTSYALVQKTNNTALAIGYGYKPFIAVYAYQK